MTRQIRKPVSGWKNPPWWPTANLRVCRAEACTDPVYDDSDPDVCLRCAIVRSEHAAPVLGQGGRP